MDKEISKIQLPHKDMTYVLKDKQARDVATNALPKANVKNEHNDSTDMVYSSKQTNNEIIDATKVLSTIEQVNSISIAPSTNYRANIISEVGGDVKPTYTAPSAGWIFYGIRKDNENEKAGMFISLKIEAVCITAQSGTSLCYMPVAKGDVVQFSYTGKTKSPTFANFIYGEVIK